MAQSPRPTRRQAQVLAFVREFLEEYNYSPTLEEIGQALEINRVTVFEHVKGLEAKGLVRTQRNLSRSIELVESSPSPSPTPLPTSRSGLRVLGTIAAGQPIEALEQDESFDIDDLVPHGRNCFLLRVSGNSMIEDQIRDGDLVLIESRPQAHPGETVVALIDGESATLKRFYPEGKTIRLEPRNAELQAQVYDARRVEIRGVVIGVLRRY